MSKCELHSHPAHAVYTLEPGKVIFSDADGRRQYVDLTKGEVMLFGSTAHAVENIGNKPVRVLVVERKGRSASPSKGADPRKVSADFNTILAEDDVFRVLLVRIRPGEKDNLHGHPSMFGYSLSGSKARFIDPNGRIEELDLKEGQPLYRDAFEHQVENIGTEDLIVVVFELKS